MPELFRLYDETTDRFDDDGYPWLWSHGDDAFPPIKDIVRTEANHRCVRCLHPYTKGQGEWSSCSEECAHGGPWRWRLPDSEEWTTAEKILVVPFPTFARAPDEGLVQARWRILTVHHLNENKADCRWWNLASLCQRCHLTIQGKVKMDRPYEKPHTKWFLPYVAGFYAAKYLSEDITRDEAMDRLEELLALELRQERLFATERLI
jgi:hypothetical protein